MRCDKVVDGYIAKIRRELYGIDRESSSSVLEELEGHIHEKAQDMAAEKGLKKPTGEIYRTVIDGMGPPGDVVMEYLKVLPKRPGIGIKAFLGLQLIIGLITIFFGFDFIRWIIGTVGLSSLDDPYFLSLMFIGLTLLFLGIMASLLVIVQFRNPEYIVHYGAGTALLTLMMAAVQMFVLARFVIWWYTEKDMNLDQLYGTVTPLFVVLTAVYMAGMRYSEDFQRRVALEEFDNKAFGARRKGSRNMMIAIFLVSLLLISAVNFALYKYSSDITDKEVLVSTEELGGPYNAHLELWNTYHDGTWFESYKIIYTMDGKEREGYFDPALRSALDWLKGNTPSNATVMNWWDYGNAVQGYAGRGSVIDDPSKDLENTIADPSSIKEWDDAATVRMVAQALVTTNTSETVAKMDALGAKYLFTSQRDASVAYALFRAAGLDEGQYIDNVGMPTEKGKESLIFRIWTGGEEITGLNLVYSDIGTRIYAIE